MTSVKCATCGETVDLDRASSARCPNCSALLDVTLDLESGRVIPVRIALVVDDDVVARMNARASLENEGYRVMEASNGPDAALIAARHSPSLALVDVSMPAMSGEHTSRLLRRTAPGIVIIAFAERAGMTLEWADGVVAKDRLEDLSPVLTGLGAS